MHKHKKTHTHACVYVCVWCISLYKSLNLEDSLLRIGFWPLKGCVDPVAALTFNQVVVGVTLSQLWQGAGQRALLLWVEGWCSNLRGVRGEPGPEVAVKSPVASGTEATVSGSLSYVPQCMSDVKYVYTANGLRPSWPSAWHRICESWGFQKCHWLTKIKEEKQPSYRLASHWLYSLPLQIRMH